jgi:hypothetical protein
MPYRKFSVVCDAYQRKSDAEGQRTYLGHGLAVQTDHDTSLGLAAMSDVKVDLIAIHKLPMSIA